jgi:hypothetical protein
VIYSTLFNMFLEKYYGGVSLKFLVGITDNRQRLMMRSIPQPLFVSAASPAESLWRIRRTRKVDYYIWPFAIFPSPLYCLLQTPCKLRSPTGRC